MLTCLSKKYKMIVENVEMNTNVETGFFLSMAHAKRG